MRRKVWYVLLIGGLLAMGATCKEGGEPPTGDTLPIVKVAVKVIWLADKRPDHKDIEVVYTAHDKTHPVQKFTTKKNGSFEFEVDLLPGDRVSVTADQVERGFLSCDMKTNDGKKTLDYVHRNDPGNVTCQTKNEKGD